MKKLVIFLLIISALTMLGCKTPDISGMSDGEYLQLLSQYDLYGTWTPVGFSGETLVLSQSSARLGDELGRWSYDDRGVRVQLGDGGAFYLDVSVRDKRVRLELDGHYYVRGEKITEHTLTIDNFWDYFELKEFSSWSESDGARWFSREYAIVPRSEYESFYADGIEVKAQFTKTYYDYGIDYEKSSFELVGNDESYKSETVNSRGTAQMGRLVLHTAFLKEGESYSFAACEDVKITAVNGKIYDVK